MYINCTMVVLERLLLPLLRQKKLLLLLLLLHQMPHLELLKLSLHALLWQLHFTGKRLQVHGDGVLRIFNAVCYHLLERYSQ